MDNIWILSYGPGDEYNIEAVFTSREKALLWLAGQYDVIRPVDDEPNTFIAEFLDAPWKETYYLDEWEVDPVE